MHSFSYLLESEIKRQATFLGEKRETTVYKEEHGGGIKSESFNSLRERKPEKIIERAVWGMLPKNRLGRAVLKKLHIYPDANHPHESQNPKELAFNIKKVEDNGW